jgi:hypothetical protein
LSFGSLNDHHSLAFQSICGDLIVIGADILGKRLQELAVETFGDGSIGEYVDGVFGRLQGKDGFWKGVLQEIVLAAFTGVSDPHPITVVYAKRRHDFGLHLLKHALFGVKIFIYILLGEEGKPLYH